VPQLEDEHEDVTGVQRVVVATRGLKQQPRLGAGPDGELLRSRDGDSNRPATLRVTNSSLMAALSELRSTVQAW
jgi:hypothetical protein